MISTVKQKPLDKCMYYLLHEKNNNSPENLHEVNEKVQGMFDEVSVSPLAFLNNHLGVPNDKATEEK